MACCELSDGGVVVPNGGVVPHGPPPVGIALFQLGV